MHAENPTLDINLAALRRNYRALAIRTPTAKAAAVVKCDAYGLGAEAVSLTLSKFEGCEIFFVAYAEEGARLRQALGRRTAEIFVFNGPFPSSLALYKKFNLTPIINTSEQAEYWAREMPGAPTAISVDTGMRRLGMRPERAPAIAKRLALNISLLVGHLACASDAAHPMNAQQYDAFVEVAQKFPDARRSFAASGGVLIDPRFGFDVTRLGVGLYGVNPLDGLDNMFEPVAEMTAPIIALHEVRAGETIGYGATYLAPKDAALATIAFGYGDGLLRAASNRGAALLGGVLCPIVGRVSMDLVVLDVSGVKSTLKIGDRAEFFGAGLPIDRAAADWGTIGYELLTMVGGLARNPDALGGRVRRVYSWDGRPAPADIFEG